MALEWSCGSNDKRWFRMSFPTKAATVLQGGNSVSGEGKGIMFARKAQIGVTTTSLLII